MNKSSPGLRFKQALASENPLQLVGVVNAYCALLAQRAGFKALYLSGAGVANASLGVPDLALTTLDDVCTDIRRITGACDLPLLVDADTGWGGALMISRAIKEINRAGAAGCHIEDQVQEKRCGHRPNKALVSTEEMCDRIKAAVDGKVDTDFIVMARTDALANEGVNAAIDRAQAYLEAGADMIFAEALSDQRQYRQFTTALQAPVLANITEFGLTPLLSTEELQQCGVRMALYPLSAFRAMSKAAEQIFSAIRSAGSQRDVLHTMQTRDELYDVLGYLDYEARLDALLHNNNDNSNKNGGDNNNDRDGNDK